MSEIVNTKKLVLLGSTGSIGTQTLSLVKELGIEVAAISGNVNDELLEKQAREFNIKHVCAVDEDAANRLRTRLADTDIEVLSGKQGLVETASLDCDTVLNSIVGVAGLEPTLAAVRAGRKIALANKETLVAGGSIVMKEIEKKGIPILPVDSEHSAIMQSRESSEKSKIKKIILTASGGPFLHKSYKELKEMKASDALKHPNWSMGRKITIDSATLMNKGFELIEAMWLFGVPAEDIQIVIHRQSIVHSAVEFDDNSIIAQLGVPDMKIPIQYALTYPERKPCPVAELDFFTVASSLNFEKPDEDTFIALKAAREAVKKGGLAPCVLNAANEAAVGLFLEGKIGFCDISELCFKAVDEVDAKIEVTLDNIIEADRMARDRILKYFNR